MKQYDVFKNKKFKMSFTQSALEGNVKGKYHIALLPTGRAACVHLFKLKN